LPLQKYNPFLQLLEMKYICLNINLTHMENEQKPTNKTALYYGVILGIATILVSVILYAMGMHYDQDWKQGTFSVLVVAIIIFIGVKKFRELNGGILSLGQAIKTGLGIALIGGIISVIYSFIFVNYIEPDFLTKLAEIQEQTMLDRFPDLTDEQIENQMEMMKKFSSPGIMAAIGMVWTLLIGFIASLISGLILKKTEEQN
jgi:hypothetical protein